MVSNPFTDLSIVAGYEAWYQTTGRRADYLEKALLGRLLAGFAGASTVLEVGCGTGHFTRWFSEQGLRAVGLDLSRPMLTASARRDLPLLVEADMLNLPFPARSADACIMMFSVLGMIYGSANRARVLGEARRVLKPGGTLVFHVHNRSKQLLTVTGLGTLLNGFARRLGLEPGDKIMRNYRGLSRLFLHLFTRREVARMLQQAGFRPGRIEALRSDRSGYLDGPAASLRADGFLVSAVAI